MSAILAMCSGHRQLPSDTAVRGMLTEMGRRGADHTELWRGDGAVIAVARHGWELEASFSGDAMVVQDETLVVAADASLYYRRDLQKKLADAGVRVTGDTPSHLVLAAYLAWGVECAKVLEGDFAFVVYDRETRTLLGARDFAGRKPLFYMETGGTLVVASTIAGAISYPEYREEINLKAVAGVAAGLLGASKETAYRGVFTLPAGESLVWKAAAGVRIARHYEPPVFESGSTLSFDDAADVLRRLIMRATEERFATQGPTSIWMSGGWDSTAVFGAGQQLLRERGAGENLEVISISYPPGDPGREDEIIEMIAGHWNCPVRWLHIEDMPFFDGIADRAARRDDPLAHVYESWNRALIGASRDAGARVALDGMGGDGLFQVSPIFFADLLGSGRWMTLAREWRAKQLRYSTTRFFKLAVQPLLPPSLLGAVAAARGGRALRGHLDRVVPDWISPHFAEREGLYEMTKSPVRRRRGENVSASETQWHLRTPWVPAILSCTSSMAIEAGVEIRSPLYDQRVIDFAATRPREERSRAGETKLLLRRAMRGLLPDQVLAPRTHRTGMTTGYFDRSMRGGLAPLLVQAFDGSSALADSGIVDMNRFWGAAHRYFRSMDRSLGVELLMTLQAEMWLRAHTGRADPAEAKHEMAAMTVVGS
jgi:asparagine synthase (glutamine-hydrolysing)